jgi:hypothetical protein
VSRLHKLLALLGADSTHCVSVTGPRLCGRSSLLAQLSSAELLGPYAALKHAVVVQADFREYRGRASSAIRYLINTVAETLEARHLNAGRVRGAGTMVDCVRGALELVPGRRVVIAIDEFERIGSDLRKDDQADLRTAVNKQPMAGYVVASHLPLSRCLEEFGDDLSDFAPSCTPLPRLLLPLTLRDIRSMIELGAPGHGPEVQARVSETVYSRVGGFPLWVQQGLAAALEALETDPLEFEHILDAELPPRLDDDLFLSYRRLSAAAQQFIEEAAFWDNVSGPEIEELQLAGWARPSRPGFEPSGSLVERWIRGRSWDRPGHRSTPRDADQYERLVRAVEYLNQRHQRALGRRNEFVIRPDVFHISSDVAFLRRSTHDADDLGRKVLALARLLYEGSGGGTKGHLRLPQWCYESPDSVVYQVTRLRHDFVHLENTDAEQADRDAKAQANIYVRYTGEPGPPSRGQARLMGDALIEEAIFQLEVLMTYCPFQPELKVGDVLADARAAHGSENR